MHQFATVSIFVRASAKICFCNVSLQVLSQVKALQATEFLCLSLRRASVLATPNFCGSSIYFINHCLRPDGIFLDNLRYCVGVLCQIACIAVNRRLD